MSERNDYYVYVYIDPRNFEEFYYGKGCHNRKDSHLGDNGDSEKAKRISAIQKKGLEPIIRVIAKGLTEREAFLVESTLIWKLGKNLTNHQKGHHSERFRPRYTMHDKLPEFDFHNSVYYVNISEGPHRSWQDCLRFGFIAAGNGRRWSEQLDRLQPGDVIAGYQSRRGYMGVGIVMTRSVSIEKFRHNGKPLSKNKLKEARLFENHNDPELAQYLVGVDWRESGKGAFRSKAGLYTPQRVVASLARQPVTRKFIEDTFGLSLDDLAVSGEYEEAA